VKPPPRIFIPQECVRIGECHPLDAELRHYLRDVLRQSDGAEVALVDRAGATFRGRVRVSRDSWAVEVVGPSAEDRAVREPLRIHLILALLKGDRTEWAVQKATELGVFRVLVGVCERSVPRAGSLQSPRVSRLQRVAAAASCQCGRATVPEVSWHDGLRAAIEVLPAAALRYRLDESSGVPPLATLLHEPAHDVVLAVGPEGSFSARERELLDGAGFLPAALGPRVLRAETAAVVAVAVVQTVLGDLGPRPPG